MANSDNKAFDMMTAAVDKTAVELFPTELEESTEFDKKEWKKFIKTQKTGDWLNVADINHDNEGNPVASSDWRDK